MWLWLQLVGHEDSILPVTGALQLKNTKQLLEFISNQFVKQCRHMYLLHQTCASGTSGGT